MPERNNTKLRERYLRWLETQLNDNPSVDKSYWELVNLMFDTPFGWTDKVPMDQNRVVDGMDLRVDFSREYKVPKTAMLKLNDCSFLEVLIGLSRRLAFVAGGDAPGWAWQLVTNLELHRASDPLTYTKARRVREAMNTVVTRTYGPDGAGGFFPLAWPDEDQTEVELWYQLNSYVEELPSEN